MAWLLGWLHSYGYRIIPELSPCNPLRWWMPIWPWKGLSMPWWLQMPQGNRSMPSQLLPSIAAAQHGIGSWPCSMLIHVVPMGRPPCKCFDVSMDLFGESPMLSHDIQDAVGKTAKVSTSMDSQESWLKPHTHTHICIYIYITYIIIYIYILHIYIYTHDYTFSTR